jgi:major type 1 subunit fimbrin (pilin)
MRHFFLKASGAVALAAASLAAHAVDGTITITGAVAATTCTVQVNGGSNSATVALPTVGTSSLQGANSFSTPVPFSIGVAGCNTNLVSMAPYFESTGSSTFTAAGRIQTSVTNVDIQILNSAGTPVNLNGSATVTAGLTGQSVPVVTLTGTSPNKTATSNFFARYFSALGSAGSGSISVNLAYTVTYQ